MRQRRADPGTWSRPATVSSPPMRPTRCSTWLGPPCPQASFERAVLPGDPLPESDAVVGVGHVINYLDSEDQVRQALGAAATALRSGGVLALDVCDLEWGRHRREAPAHARIGSDWAIITEFDVPSPTCFVREITTFVKTSDGAWRRADEHHDNLLVDTAALPDLLSGYAVDAEVRPSFGSETLPVGLVALVGTKSGAG